MLVEPGVAIGPVRLGMTREEIRSMLGEPALAFRRGETDFDEYDDVSLQCGFDSQGLADTIAVHPPATAEVFGISALDMLVSECRTRLEGVGVQVLASDNAGFVAAGFAVFTDGDRVEAVTVFDTDYQEKLLALYR